MSTEIDSSFAEHLLGAKKNLHALGLRTVLGHSIFFRVKQPTHPHDDEDDPFLAVDERGLVGLSTTNWDYYQTSFRLPRPHKSQVFLWPELHIGV